MSDEMGGKALSMRRIASGLCCGAVFLVLDDVMSATWKAAVCALLLVWPIAFVIACVGRRAHDV